MPKRTHALACAAALLVPAPAVAADGADASSASGAPAEEPVYPQWSGSVGLGLFSASGNTESTSVNLDIEAGLEYERWRHALAVTAYAASEDGEDTAERYSGRLQSNYQLTERTYLFAAGRYETDRFGAFDRRASLTAGVGRRLVATDALELDAEAGAGYRVSEPDGTNERNGESVVSLRGDLAWRLSATSAFTQELEVISGSDNTATRSVTGLESDLTGDLALKVTYTVEHNSDVPADTENTDTFTAITLAYAF